MLQRVIRKVANSIGIEVTRVDTEVSDLSPDERRIVNTVRPFTMTSLQRIAALVQAILYTIENSIPGDFVECGVWKGGSSMAAALTYLEHGVTEVDLFLFDTFAGMPAPGHGDYRATTRKTAREMLDSAGGGDEGCARASEDEVRGNLLSTGYPADRVHLVKGMVEDTIPLCAPANFNAAAGYGLVLVDETRTGSPVPSALQKRRSDN